MDSLWNSEWGEQRVANTMGIGIPLISVCHHLAFKFLLFLPFHWVNYCQTVAICTEYSKFNLCHLSQQLSCFFPNRAMTKPWPTKANIFRVGAQSYRPINSKLLAHSVHSHCKLLIAAPNYVFYIVIDGSYFIQLRVLSNFFNFNHVHLSMGTDCSNSTPLLWI